MAVHYTGGGGLLDSLMGAMGVAAPFVPGLQGIAPYLMGAGALANGDVGGAVGSVAAPMIGNMMEKAGAAASTKTANRESLFGALANGMQNPRPEAMAGDPTGGSWTRAHNGMPDWNTDPVTGETNRYKHPWGWR